MYTTTVYTKYQEAYEAWLKESVQTGLPKAPRVLGTRYNRHNSNTPPLDFRLNGESQFDS